ncbi:MAG: M1 family aminopeptidase [bacterium]
MKKYLLIFSLVNILVAIPLLAQDDYWQQDVHYTMNVTLLPQEHALTGEETLVYHNNSPDTLYKFYMHLYPNAYRGPESVYARDARRFFREVVANPEDGGYLRVENLRILSSDQPTDALTLTAFKVKDTILEADLPEPLPPGGDLHIGLSFYLKIRKFVRRAGYRGNQFDFAQWYPKVCVYDETGWNAEPFHFMGEFYGEFGTFDVTINVPYEYIVSATGVVVAGDPGWNLVRVNASLTHAEWNDAYREIKKNIREQGGDGKIRTVKFHAEQVHDFAWVACPDFLYESAEWDGIPIHVLYRSYAKNQWSKVAAERGTRALQWLSAKFGRYPYPQLTITHGLLGGGMEYPMLVMDSSASESLILHEVGHIYFYGIFGNNEWKEAWLDEGFTSFQTRWYLESRYGKWGFDREEFSQRANWLQKKRPQKTSRESNRDFALFYMNSGHNEPISKLSYRFNEPLDYSVNAYTKGAFFYDMLKYVVGDETFEKICHEYFKRWAFKHVNEQRFKAVCEEVSGQDLDWFFDEWLHNTVTVDYALGKVKKKKTADGWHTEVEIRRNEKGIMPVDVQLTTQDGQTFVARWDGIDLAGTVQFETASKPKTVLLDPEDAVLDNARINNGPLRLQFVFEYPNMTYSPRDAFLFAWRPSAWYNEVDKLRLGGRIKGRYYNSRNVELGSWLGLNSGELDVRFKYSNHVKPLGAGTVGSLLVQKMEGRLEADAHLSIVKSRYLSQPPQHRIVIGFNASRLLDEKYTLLEFDQKNDFELQTWEKGDVNKLYFRYQVNPRGLHWFSNFNLGLETSRETWRSDFTFSYAFSEVKFWLPRHDRGLFLRLYAGKVIDAEDAPVQDLLFLDGANPRERFKRFYLRSNGSIPEELHYHLPGGGNLRGYFNNPVFGDQIFALNIELRHNVKLPAPGKRLNGLLGTTSLVAFVDVANMEFLDASNETFSDAGIGLRFHRFLPDNWYTIFAGGRNLTLRLDFPVWVSDSLPDENNLRFRWVFGFEQAF